MTTSEYLDRLLVKYAGTFDIYQPYVIHGKEYPAYGYFFSHTEKYVLVRSANMWSSDCYEHILFVETDEVTKDLLEEVYAIVKDYMEPVLVRKGNEQPEANHMYSYLTVAILSDRAVLSPIKRAVKRFKFDKGYQFSMRGFAQAHIICASMEDESVCANYAGRAMKKVFLRVFREIKEGKPGFAQIREEQNIRIHQQE